MRNLWKGFVIGALTGAGIGAARDWDRRRRAKGNRSASHSSGLASDNVWKGFVIGALTGAGVGVLADIGERAGQDLAEAAVQTSRAVREHAPELAHRVVESDTAKVVGEAVSETAQRTADAAQKAGSAVSDLTEEAVQAAHEKLPTT